MQEAGKLSCSVDRLTNKTDVTLPPLVKLNLILVLFFVDFKVSRPHHHHHQLSEIFGLNVYLASAVVTRQLGKCFAFVSMIRNNFDFATETDFIRKKKKLFWKIGFN